MRLGVAFFVEKISNLLNTIDFVIKVGLWLRLKIAVGDGVEKCTWDSY